MLHVLNYVNSYLTKYIFILKKMQGIISSYETAEL